MAITLQNLLRAGGALQFMILFASALTPKVLDWRSNLATLDSFLRRLFWVYGAFIFMTIFAFGLITTLNASTLAAGTPLARSVCGFIAFFWLARLVVQLAVFRSGPVLNHWLLKLGYHALTAVFTYLTGVYGIAALLPA